MNQYLKASVTYPMTEDVVVDKTLIATWLTYDDNMQAVFSEDAVREWMREFGKTYDTYGKTRSITSPYGTRQKCQAERMAGSSTKIRKPRT